MLRDLQTTLQKKQEKLASLDKRIEVKINASNQIPSFTSPFAFARTFVLLRSHLRSPPLTPLFAFVRTSVRTTTTTHNFLLLLRPPPAASSAPLFTPRPFLGIWCPKSTYNFQITLKLTKNQIPSFI